MTDVNAFTGRSMGIDGRIWLVMLAISVLCLGLLGYKTVSRKKEESNLCAPAIIAVNGKNVEGIAVCHLNRFARFDIRMDTAAKVDWNFGDGSAMFEGLVVAHKFSKEGSYKVTATVDGICRFEEEVVVTGAVVFSGPEQGIIEIYADSLHLKVGSQLNLACASNMEVYSYEWKLAGTAGVQNKPVATFAFHSPGKYEVQLMINNDPAMIATKRIEVVSAVAPQMPLFPDNAGSTPNMGPPPTLPKPGENPFSNTNGQPPLHTGKNAENQPASDSSKQASSKPKAVDIDEKTFMILMQDVIDGNKEIQELNAYLCYKGTKVDVNGKTPLQNLNVFCNDMRGKKNNKIQSLNFIRNDQNCIQTIVVKLKEKKGFFEKLLPKKKKG